jgi:hypothetical protein
VLISHTNSVSFADFVSHTSTGCSISDGSGGAASYDGTDEVCFDTILFAARTCGSQNLFVEFLIRACNITLPLQL